MKNALFMCVAVGALCTAAAIVPAEAQGRMGGEGGGGMSHGASMHGGPGMAASGRVRGPSGPAGMQAGVQGNSFGAGNYQRSNYVGGQGNYDRRGGDWNRRGGDWDRRGGGWGWGPAAAVGAGLAVGAVAADVAYGGYGYDEGYGYGYDYAPGYAPGYAYGAGYDCGYNGQFGWGWGGGSCAAPGPVAAVTYGGPAYVEGPAVAAGYGYGYDRAPRYRSVTYRSHERYGRMHGRSYASTLHNGALVTGRSVAVTHAMRRPPIGGKAGVASGGADMRGAGASHGAGPLGGNPR